VSADPFEPWALVPRDQLAAVFDLETFDAQIRALLELHPHASAKELLALPWEEKHTKAEVQRIREAWADERARANAAPSNPDDAIPIEERLWNQMVAHAQMGAFADAKKAHELLVQISKQKAARPDAKEDDFSKLTDVEVMALAALAHKLRGEALSPTDIRVLAYIGMLAEDA